MQRQRPKSWRHHQRPVPQAMGAERGHLGTDAASSKSQRQRQLRLQGVTPALDHTYRSARSYAAAMIDFHDQRLLAQPNAVFNEDDCLFQMATHAVFRLHADRFVGEEHNHGPVVLQLTNLHAGNTFVDGNWNIACLIDPGWVCSLPVDSFRVLFWLTEGSTDQVCGKGHHAYNEVRQEFMAAWAEVEREMGNNHGFALS